jgi:hypothetical protein
MRQLETGQTGGDPRKFPDDSIGRYNDGRFLETEMKLLQEGKGMTWDFALGEISTNSVLRINANGEWTELAQIAIGPQLPRKLLELTVRPQK